MAELTSERIEELRRVAKAATPGPWEWRHKSRTLHTQINRQEPYKYGSVVMWQETTVDGDREIEAKEEDFDYIERMDPSTVLALLAELERLRRERETLAAAVRACERYTVMPDPESLSYDADADEVEFEEWRKAHETALALLDGEKGGGGA